MPSRHELAAAAFENPEAVTSRGGAQASSIKPKTPSFIDPKPSSPSPAGQRASQTTHRLGERQNRNGHEYELQERGQRHEWVRVDQEKGGPGEMGGGGKPPQNTGAAGGADKPDPKQAHEFAKKQLGSIQGPVKGLLAAMHKSGDKQTFDAKHTAPIVDWMKQNAGQNVGGGAVRDLGGGVFGFSSPAGAVMVKEEGGKHTVHFTADVGPVHRAMRGEDPMQGHAPPQTPGKHVPQMSGAPPVAGSERAQAMGRGEGDRPELEDAPIQGQQPGQPPAASGQNPFGPQTGFEPSQATPQQMASASALTEKPQPAARPTFKNPREAADHARGELETAVNSWQEALAGGLSPQGNRHWQQYVAARKAVWSNLNQVAKEQEKVSKPKKDENAGLDEHEVAAKTADPVAFADLQKMGGKSLGSLYDAAIQAISKGHRNFEADSPGKSQAERNPSITGSQKPQWRHAGDAFKESAEGKAMAKHGIEPKGDTEAGKRGHAQNVADAEREAGTAPKPTVEEQQAAIHKEQPWSTDGLTNVQGPRVEQGREAIKAADGPVEPPKPSPVRGRAAQEAKMRAEALNKGFTGIEPPPKPTVFEEPQKRFPDKPASDKPKAPKKIHPDKLKSIVDQRLEQHGMTGDDRLHKTITDAINQGHIASGKHLNSVLKETKRLSGKPGFTGDAAAKAIGNLRNRREGSIASPNTKKSKAEEQAILNAHAESHGIPPEDHRAMLEEMLPSYIEKAYKPDREDAKTALREKTGMTPAKIAQLENKGGLDSDALSKHDKLIAEVAAQYPQYFGDDYMDSAFELLREGPKGKPGITDPDFLAHVDEFLAANKGAGGGAIADDDVSAVPFSRIRKGFVLRYRNWLKAANAFVMP